MKEKHVGMLWGVVLILLGGWFLLQGQKGFIITDPYIGMAINGTLSALFFASYFVSGKQRWGWLFPACFFAGATLVILLSLTPGPHGGWISAPVLLAVGAPFLVAYFQQPDTRRWALIPAYISLVLTLIAALAENIRGEFVGTLIMLSVALPFVIVYLTNRTRVWALVPAAILTVIGLIPAMTTVVNGENMGPAIMFLFAIPFAVVYMLRPTAWWAILPAGMFGFLGLGLVVLVTVFGGGSSINPLEQKVISGIFLLGWALTFLVVWLRRATAKTGWAIYPAAALGLLGLVAVLGGQQAINTTWPVVLIAGGGLLLFKSYRQKLPR